MFRPEEQGSPRARASQLLEMLIMYGLIDAAWLNGDEVTVMDGRTRHMSPEEALDEYGDKLALMAERVIERSDATTTVVSVPVGRAEGPVPYILDVGDRVTEYQRYWDHV